MTKRIWKGNFIIQWGDRFVNPGETIVVSDAEAAQLDNSGHPWIEPEKKTAKKKEAK